MTHRVPIGDRPSTNAAADQWVRRGDGPASPETLSRPRIHSARLTLDVTPTLRGRIKIVAFKNGMTVAQLLRRLLEREFGGDPEAR